VRFGIEGAFNWTFRDGNSRRYSGAGICHCSISSTEDYYFACSKTRDGRTTQTHGNTKRVVTRPELLRIRNRTNAPGPSLRDGCIDSFVTECHLYRASFLPGVKPEGKVQAKGGTGLSAVRLRAVPDTINTVTATDFPQR
jgi:hypothetical protein